MSSKEDNDSKESKEPDYDDEKIYFLSLSAI